MKKKVFTWFLAFMIVISSLPISALMPAKIVEAAEIADANITIIINSLHENLIEPVDLTVPYTTFSALGLSVDNDDPGKITPLHVLAQYFMQRENATPETMSNFIDVNNDGSVNRIKGNNGIDNETNADAQWVCRIANLNIITDFDIDAITSGNIYFYGISCSDTQYVVNTSPTFINGTGMESRLIINVKRYSGSGSTTTAMAGSVVNVKRINADGSKTPITPETGKYTLKEMTNNNLYCTFNDIGIYEIDIQKVSDDKCLSNIIYSIVEIKNGADYGFEQDWNSVNWTTKLMAGAISGYSSGLTVIGSTGQTVIDWRSSDESVVKITADYDKKRINYQTTNDTTEDKVIQVIATAVDPYGATQTKTFPMTVLGSRTTYLSNLEVEGLPDFQFDENQRTYRFTLNKDITQITLTATPKMTDLISNLKLKVSNVQYQFGEPITFTIDPDKVLNSISLAIERYHPDYNNGNSAATTTYYTIQFYKSATTLPVYDAFYPMGRVDTANTNVLNAFTPRSSDEINTQSSWQKIMRLNGEGMPGWGKWSYPIVVNENIYIAVDSELRKYDLNGNLLKTGALGATVLGGGYTGWLAYGDGMIFVPAGGAVYAYNADDLSLLWHGSTGIAASQSSCPILYYNGYIYSGITTGTGDPPAGGFYCMDTIDYDPSTPLESKDAIWKIDGPSFYWAGACIAGNYLVVPCDTGDIYSINIAQSITQGQPVITDILNVSANDNVGITDPEVIADRCKIRTPLLYDAARQTIYFPSYSRIFHSVKIGTDGKFDKGENNANVKSLDIGVYNNSPVTYNGRVYICGSEGLNVIDADTFELIYTAPFENGEDPYIGILTLSNAYATEENGNQVYLYFFTSSKPNYIYMLSDNEKATEGTVKKLYTVPDYFQYSTSNIIVADNGSLLAVNDYCALFCVKSLTNAQSLQQQKDVQAMIDALDDILTNENEAAYFATQTAYDALTDGQKGEINNAKLIALAEQDEGRDAARDNKRAVDNAAEEINDKAYSVTMVEANSKNAVKSWIEGELSKLELGGVNTSVTVTGFTAAAEGTKNKPLGESGSFTFTVNLSKGEGDERVTESVQLTGVVTATPYSGGITVTFRLIGDTVDPDGKAHFNGYVNWIKTRTYTMEAGDTVYDLV